MSGQHSRHVGDRQKCLLFGWWSQQTQIPTLPAKDSARPRERSNNYQGQLASLLHADYQWQEMPCKDPKVRRVVELGQQAHTLQEQSPGVCMQALRQTGAQSGSQPSLPHGKLAGAN